MGGVTGQLSNRRPDRGSRATAVARTAALSFGRPSVRLRNPASRGLCSGQRGLVPMRVCVASICLTAFAVSPALAFGPAQRVDACRFAARRQGLRGAGAPALPRRLGGDASRHRGCAGLAERDPLRWNDVLAAWRHNRGGRPLRDRPGSLRFPRSRVRQVVPRYPAAAAAACRRQHLDESAAAASSTRA